MLEQILSREGFERPILIGQSMGGYVSQAFMRLFPDRACGFVSVDSCPLDRSYYTAIELWALKHVKGMYRAIPWKSLCSMGSKGCAASEYYGVGRQGILDCIVHGLGDNELPVIVVDLYLVETL